MIVISFPKSGRTWLRVMLDRVGIKLTYSHDKAMYGYGCINTKDLLFRKEKYKKHHIVFLVRDPRDTIVSAYIQMTRRQPEKEEKYEGSISQFIRDGRLGIRKILRFHSIWHENREVPLRFHLVRYEDLHAETFDTLSKVIKFIGTKTVSDSTISNAVEFGRFDNMQELERLGKLRGKYGKMLFPKDEKDTETFKVRRGKVGGYVDYLTPDDIEYCNKCMREDDNPYYADN